MISMSYESLGLLSPDEHNEYWVVDAEPNGIMPPPPTGNGPGRNRRRPNWPVPIAHRGGLCWGYPEVLFSNKNIVSTMRVLLFGYPW